MSSFAAARKNMVDCQIHPSGVVNPRILEVFQATPREAYVAAALASVVYKDEETVFADGRFMLDPTTHARMLQALEPKETDVVLDIGCAGGYSSAILSPLVSTVIALEEKQKYLTDAEKIWAEHGAINIAAFKGALKKGCPEHGPYNLIIMNGSAAEIPETLVGQLTEDGKLIAIIRKPDAIMGQVTLIQNLGAGGYSTLPLFEAGTPYLPGYQPLPAFKF